MSCSKYTLTNSGSTVITFNYRRCDDSMWEYQVGLLPNETKNIWLINGTYSTAQANSIVLVNQGAFPPPNVPPTPTPTPSTTAPVTPTPTPTPSVTATHTQTPTASSTQTPTGTPTNTPTNTLTPSETNTPIRYPFSISCHSETSFSNVCNGDCTTATLYGDNPVFTFNSFFYACENGDCPGVQIGGWYLYSGNVYELDSSGVVIGGAPCGATPTPTPTNTNTPTMTQTPTSTRTFVVYSLGTGTTANNACIASPISIYGSPAQVDGPDISETLYQDSGLVNPVGLGYYSNGTLVYLTDASGVIQSFASC